jgi:hypothetical protein
MSKRQELLEKEAAELTAVVVEMIAARKAGHVKALHLFLDAIVKEFAENNPITWDYFPKGFAPLFVGRTMVSEFCDELEGE